MRRRVPTLLLAAILLFPMTASTKVAQDGKEIDSQIRREGMEHSQIMHTMHLLTDVYGPRLTGTPNLKAAGEWAIKQMRDWGLENGHLEPWDFGHPGWTNDHFTAHILSPVKDQVTCEVLAWTPGTDGTVTGQAFQMIPPEQPTQTQLTTYLDGIKERVKGHMVLVGKRQTLAVSFQPPNKRMDDKAARERFSGDNPNAGNFPNRQGGGPQQTDPSKLTSAQVNEQIDQFLVANKALVRINDAGREHGQIRAFNNRTFDLAKVVPTVVMRNEDYGRISRILDDGTAVELEFNIVNRTYPEGKTAYNTISEIPGTDKREQVVMLGGHLDSWHSATGATDNAIGCAVMMEAARIIKSLGLKPRRTIRVALWSGEEEGLLGSQAYVKEHFGSAEEPKPDFGRLDAYFNIDSGTGRARGMSVFGPSEASALLRPALTTFEDLGFMGVISSRGRMLGGSDHTSFSHAGLPGIGVQQDPIEYGTHTWHTNLDTYERIVESDAKSSAVVIAAAVYFLTMQDQAVPRFAQDQMPALTASPRAQTARP
jgi:carboxypeptidase Q